MPAFTPIDKADRGHQFTVIYRIVNPDVQNVQKVFCFTSTNTQIFFNQQIDKCQRIIELSFK